jgi:predicted nucleic acid-binding Zn ribbon protein
VCFAEALSHYVCEICGATADVGQTGGTWAYTRCRTCAAKLPPHHAALWKPREECDGK